VHLLRNFLADYANHDELANGVFVYGSYNAPPLVKLREEQRKAFAKVLSNVDGGRIRTAKDLAKAIIRRVYTETPRRWFPPEKYQAVNLNRIVKADFTVDDQTIEIRAHPAQRNADEFLKLARLYEARIRFLRQNPGTIPYVDHPPTETSAPLSDAGVRKFAAYVTESGLKWEDYESFTGPRPRVAVDPGSIVPYRTEFRPVELHDQRARPSAGISLIQKRQRFYRRYEIQREVFSPSFPTTREVKRLASAIPSALASPT
jgi:hypothetical protein